MKKNTKYNISISKLGYKSKPKTEWIQWIPSLVNEDELYDYLQKGHSICGNYGFSDKFTKGRTKDNFIGSPFVYVDIDDVDIDEDTFFQTVINKWNGTELKPTYVYCSFSHQLDGKGNRYRLVYLFDKEIPKAKYGCVFAYYNNMVRKELGIGDCVDKAVVSHCYTQPMHSTCHKIINCYNIYNADDVLSKVNDCEEEEVKVTKPRKEKIDHFTIEDKALFTNTDLADWCSMILGDKVYKQTNISDLPKRYEKYKLVSVWHPRKKQKDGDNRRASLYSQGKKYRYLNPQATSVEILALMVKWLREHCLSDYDCITRKELLDKANSVMDGNSEDYIEYRKKCMDNPFEIVDNELYIDEIKAEIKEEKLNVVDELFENIAMPSIEDVMANHNIGLRQAQKIAKAMRGGKSSKQLRQEQFNTLKTQGCDKNAIKDKLSISESTYQRLLKASKVA